MEEKIYNPKIYDDEDLRRKCGVYQIRNLVSGKLYVGSSNNLLFRKRYGHLDLLKIIPMKMNIYKILLIFMEKIILCLKL